MTWIIVLILECISLMTLGSHITVPRFRFFIDKMGLLLLFLIVTSTQKDHWVGHILAHISGNVDESLLLVPNTFILKIGIVLLDRWFSNSILNQSP